MSAPCTACGRADYLESVQALKVLAETRQQSEAHREAFAEQERRCIEWEMQVREAGRCEGCGGEAIPKLACEMCGRTTTLTGALYRLWKWGRVLCVFCGECEKERQA